MITTVKIKKTECGLYLSARTKRSKYGQCYNTTDDKKPNFVKSTAEAINRFKQFYNQFE